MKPSFVWGAATSAHQVEGHNIHNDWWAWERRTPGVTASGAAADHFTRFADDFALAKALGHTAHRLSIEWSRVQPAQDRWSEKALPHYRMVLTELRDQGLQCFLTLHHFTTPQWLAAQGGWENPAAPLLFRRYAQRVVEAVGDLVDVWVTINEPVVYATESYWRKRWPPQQRSFLAYQRVLRHLAAAHEQAYEAIHETYPEAQVGIAKHWLACLGTDSPQWLERRVNRLYSWWFNHRFYQLTRGRHDYLGVNFYFANDYTVRWWPPQVTVRPWSGAVSDMGWPIRPEGLAHVLREAWQYKLPLYVTENGLADATDAQRPDFIRDHLRMVEQVQAEGVDVRGYFHWSLLDNFEWAEGFTPRFGLVAVDYETQGRTVRPSAQVYRAIIETAQRRS